MVAAGQLDPSPPKLAKLETPDRHAVGEDLSGHHRAAPRAPDFNWLAG